MQLLRFCSGKTCPITRLKDMIKSGGILCPGYSTVLLDSKNLPNPFSSERSMTQGTLMSRPFYMDFIVEVMGQVPHHPMKRFTEKHGNV